MLWCRSVQGEMMMWRAQKGCVVYAAVWRSEWKRELVGEGLFTSQTPHLSLSPIVCVPALEF